MNERVSTWGKAAVACWLFLGAWLAVAGGWLDRSPGPNDGGIDVDGHLLTVIGHQLRQPLSWPAFAAILVLGSMPYLAAGAPEKLRRLSQLVIAGVAAVALTDAGFFLGLTIDWLALIAGLGIAVAYYGVWCEISLALFHGPRGATFGHELVRVAVITAPVASALALLVPLFVLGIHRKPALPFQLVPFWVAATGSAIALAFLAVLWLRARRVEREWP